MSVSFIGLTLSYIMALYLFSITFIEAIKISNEQGKVHGFTLIFSFTSAIVFTTMANYFYFS